MRLRNSIMASAIALGLQAVPVAQAATPAKTEPAPPVTGDELALTKGELERLHINNLVLEAQVQAAQLARQLAENKGSTAPPPLATPDGAVGYPGLPGATPPVNVNRAHATVLEINGRDKHLRATLQLPSGQTLMVTQGSRLPGTDLTVNGISLSGVALSDGTLITF